MKFVIILGLFYFTEAVNIGQSFYGSASFGVLPIPNGPIQPEDIYETKNLDLLLYLLRRMQSVGVADQPPFDALKVNNTGPVSIRNVKNVNGSAALNNVTVVGLGKYNFSYQQLRYKNLSIENAKLLDFDVQYPALKFSGNAIIDYLIAGSDFLYDITFSGSASNITIAATFGLEQEYYRGLFYYQIKSYVNEIHLDSYTISVKPHRALPRSRASNDDDLTASIISELIRNEINAALWHYTADQVDAFLNEPVIEPVNPTTKPTTTSSSKPTTSSTTKPTTTSSSKPTTTSTTKPTTTSSSKKTTTSTTKPTTTSSSKPTTSSTTKPTTTSSSKPTTSSTTKPTTTSSSKPTTTSTTKPTTTSSSKPTTTSTTKPTTTTSSKTTTSSTTKPTTTSSSKPTTSSTTKPTTTSSSKPTTSSTTKPTTTTSSKPTTSSTTKPTTTSSSKPTTTSTTKPTTTSSSKPTTSSTTKPTTTSSSKPTTTSTTKPTTTSSSKPTTSSTTKPTTTTSSKPTTSSTTKPTTTSSSKPTTTSTTKPTTTSSSKPTTTSTTKPTTTTSSKPTTSSTTKPTTTSSSKPTTTSTTKPTTTSSSKPTTTSKTKPTTTSSSKPTTTSTTKPTTTSSTKPTTSATSKPSPSPQPPLHGVLYNITAKSKRGIIPGEKITVKDFPQKKNLRHFLAMLLRVAKTGIRDVPPFEPCNVENVAISVNTSQYLASVIFENVSIVGLQNIETLFVDLFNAENFSPGVPKLLEFLASYEQLSFSSAVKMDIYDRKNNNYISEASVDIKAKAENVNSNGNLTAALGLKTIPNGVGALKAEIDAFSIFTFIHKLEWSAYNLKGIDFNILLSLLAPFLKYGPDEISEALMLQSRDLVNEILLKIEPSQIEAYLD